MSDMSDMSDISFPSEKRPFHKILLSKIASAWNLAGCVSGGINRQIYAIIVYELCLVLSESIMSDEQIKETISGLRWMENKSRSKKETPAEDAKDSIVELIDFFAFSLIKKLSGKTSEEIRSWRKEFNEWRKLKRYAFWQDFDKNNSNAVGCSAGCRACGE